MADEGLHEIQLNGKQLIFLSMAAAVVAVVVFLSGVMVGRGVRAEKGAATQSEAMALSPDSAPPAGNAAGAGSAQTPPAAVPPPATPPPQPVSDELSYYNRLEGQNAAAEAPKSAPGAPPTAKPPVEKAAAATPEPAAVAPTQAARADAPAKPQPGSAPPTADAGGGAGYSLQVVALKDRAAADAIVKRLTTKGYQAYLLDPPAGSSVFRVRVGPFKTRPEAEEAKRRLEKEERFKPLLTR